MPVQPDHADPHARRALAAAYGAEHRARLEIVAGRVQLARMADAVRLRDWLATHAHILWDEL